MAKDKQPQVDNTSSTEPTNADEQAVDKAPGEERGKAEPVTKEDLKGKKNDADLTARQDQPLERNKNTD